MKKLFATRLMLDIAGRLIMMVIVIFLSRRLGVAGFGQLSYGLSIVNISYFFLDFGMASLFLREMGRAGDADREEVWEKFFGLKAVLGVVVLLVGGLASFKLWRWENPVILVALFVYMIGNCFVDFFNLACNAVQNLKVSGVVLLLHKGLVALSVVAVCLAEPTLSRAAFALAGASITGMLISLFIIGKTLKLPIKVEWKPDEWIRWIKASLPLALSNVMIIAYGRFGILFLPGLRGETETGLYAAAHKLFEAGYILPSALIGVLMPRLSKSHSESPEAFAADLKKSIQWIALLAAAFLAASEPLSGLMIRLLFGKQYLGAVPALRFLLVVDALVLFNVFLAHIMIVYNQLVWHAVNAALTALVCAGVTYLGIQRLGGVGAAASLLISELVFTALTVFALSRLRYNETRRARSSAG